MIFIVSFPYDDILYLFSLHLYQNITANLFIVLGWKLNIKNMSDIISLWCSFYLFRFRTTILSLNGYKYRYNSSQNTAALSITAQFVSSIWSWFLPSVHERHQSSPNSWESCLLFLEEYSPCLQHEVPRGLHSPKDIYPRQLEALSLLHVTHSV